MKWSRIASLLGIVLFAVTLVGCSSGDARRGRGPDVPDADPSLGDTSLGDTSLGDTRVDDTGEDVDPGGPGDTGRTEPDTSSPGEPDATAQCTSRAQCAAGEDCVGGRCVASTECINSLDCAPDGVCDVASGRCVECVDSLDCPGEERCGANVCQAVIACGSDRDCTPHGLLCDRAIGECRRCVTNTDCPGTLTCVDGDCADVVPTCTPGRTCEGPVAVVCSAAGVVTRTDCAAEGNRCIDGTCQPPAPSCSPGRVAGRACAPSGFELAGAEVRLTGTDCSGAALSLRTTTGADGSFTFENVPSGQHTIELRAGSFRRSRSIAVNAGLTTDLSTGSSRLCLAPDAARIALLEGRYDHVDGILDSLGLQYDVKGGDDEGVPFILPGNYADSVAFLKSAELMQYDILFINCGELWNRLVANDSASVPTIVANLQSFVAAGKSLYVSDHAHPFVERPFPQMLDFHGDDGTPSAARMGYAPQTITANVLTADLRALLGRNTAQIQFPHAPPEVVNNNWVIAELAGSGTTVHLQGNARLCGDSSGCTEMGGTVIGAPLLTSYEHPSGGTVIFTSFHNKEGASYNEDMRRLMRHMLFKL